jgi:hypothetical protein
MMIAVFEGAMAASKWASAQGPCAWNGWIWVRNCKLISRPFGADGVDADTIVTRSAKVESTMAGLGMGYVHILIATPDNREMRPQIWFKTFKTWG